MTTIPTAAPDTQLAVMVASSGLGAAKQEALVKALHPIWTRAADVLKESAAIVVTDATQLREMKQAKDAQIALMRCRTGSEKIRKEMLAETALETKTINQIFQKVEAIIVVEEDRLRAAAEFAKRAEAERLATRKAERETALRPYVADLALYAYEALDDEKFQQLLESCKRAHEAELARAAKAREDAALAEKQRAQEAQILAAQNAQLAIDKAEAEKELALQRELADADRREAQEARRKVEETARKDREALEAKAQQERQEAAKRLRKAEDARLASEAREKARVDADAARARAEAAAMRKAARAPDRTKLLGIATMIGAIKGGPFSAADVADELETILQECVRQIESLAKSLEN